MNRIMIACGTLRRELLAAMDAWGCTAPVIWLEAGAHNVPKKRLAEVQDALNECQGYDTVLLCMTFCGNSLIGLHSGDRTLVLPRFDDCISLLRGIRQRANDTYYLTEGWLRGSENLLNEYDAAVRKYGTDRADRIFSSMLRNYRSLVWICDSPAVPDRVRIFAEHFDLDLACEKPDTSLFDKLVLGHWDENFLVIPPNTEVTMEMREGGATHA